MIELSYGHKRQNGKPAETGRGKTSNQQWQRKVWQSAVGYVLCHASK